MEEREKEEFGRQLQERVPGISNVDLDRIFAVAFDEEGKSLQAIADELHVTRDGLNYSLHKLYSSPAVPGINNINDLRAWGKGLIPNPFGLSIKIVDEFTDLRPADRVVALYGSGLDNQSLARTTGQDPHEIEYIRARLEGYVLEWGAGSHRFNYSDAEWKSLDDIVWLWLGIRQTGNPADVVNVGLVKLRGPQFRRLQSRESHYREVSVTGNLLVGGLHWGNYFRSLNIDVITFVPDPSRTINNLEGRRVAVRAGYYDSVEEFLRIIHPDIDARLPELPPGVERLEGYPTDDRVVKEYWETISKAQLDSYYSRIDKDLYASDVTRQTGDGFETIPWGLRDIILNRDTWNQVIKTAESALSLSVKAHQLVLSDQKLFDLNLYTETDRRLADPRLANSFADRPVVARVDLALRGDKLVIFEINSGSPAGMYHLDELAERQWRQHESGELTGDLATVLEPPPDVGVCDAIVEAFCRGWHEFRERKADSGFGEAPWRVAIVDWNINKVAAYTEFQHFRKLLLERIYGITEAEGAPVKADEVVILDIQDLRYRDDHRELTDASGRPIQAVYKRLLWQEANDIGMGGLDSPLCRAYVDDAAFVMNSFHSHLAGSKLNMAVAKSPSFEARCNDIGIDLTEDEGYVLQHNMPETFLWGPESIDDSDPQEVKSLIMSDVTNWVLKGYHGKGGQEFIDGAPPNDIPPVDKFLSAWETGGYIAQRHQDHGVVDMPVYDSRQLGTVWGRYPFILGAYVIDGKCVGIEAKFADEPPINVNRRARRTAVFSLKQ